jgi:hypothetical protein
MNKQHLRKIAKG